MLMKPLRHAGRPAHASHPLFLYTAYMSGVSPYIPPDTSMSSWRSRARLICAAMVQRCDDAHARVQVRAFGAPG